MKSSIPVSAVAALVALVLFGACDDIKPPEVSITSPADSVAVSGTVTVEATAYDSSGVVNVQFFADGVLVGEDQLADYSASWNTDPLADESWHALNCVAWDLAGNAGYSDTVRVQVRRGGLEDILHASFPLAGGYRFQVEFAAEAGDTVAGDMRVANGRALPLFLCLTAADYELYRQGGQFQAVHREDNVSEFSMQAAMPAADTFYLVFSNTGTDSLDIWARFSLK